MNKEQFVKKYRKHIFLFECLYKHEVLYISSEIDDYGKEITLILRFLVNPLHTIQLSMNGEEIAEAFGNPISLKTGDNVAIKINQY